VSLARRSFLIGTAAVPVSAAALAWSRAVPLFGPPERLKLGPAPNGTVDVRQFGALGDGRTDDRRAIQAAIDALADAGGGTAIMPPGTYVVSRAGTSPVAVTLRSGITLMGSGTASVLKLADDSGGHLVNVTRERDCGLRSLVLDGNRDHQPSMGHAFRSGGVIGLSLQNLIVRNAYHYGIGLESGTIRDVSIDHVLIEDCGADGIDIKNKMNDDASIAITDVTVRRWSLKAAKNAKAAIDCRGPLKLSRIRVEEPGAEDAVGIRMRNGEATDANGLGGHNSRLDDFQVHMGGGHAQIGVDVVARQVSVSNGTIVGGFRGLVVQETGFRGTGIQVNGCSGSGILIDTDRPTLRGDGAMLSNCSARGCGRDGIEIRADLVQVVDCASNGNAGSGLLITGTANGARVVGGNFAANRAGAVVNRGIGSRIAVPVR
jgi:hypothetical protein